MFFGSLRVAELRVKLRQSRTETTAEIVKNMTTLRWGSGLLLGIAVVVAAALWLQRQEAEVLRSEIAMLREERVEREKLQAENRRLATQAAPAEEVARLRADHAAIGRLRTEIETLRVTTEAAAKRVESAKPGR